MQLGKYSKVPADRKRYSIDYSDWLDQSELVSSVTFGVTPSEAGMLVIDGTSIDTTKTISVFYASAGNVGSVYTVAVTMTTSGGQIREDTVQYTVKSP
jgi:hypothetical protein